MKCASSHSLVTMKKGASIDDDQHLQVLSDTMHHISLSLLQTPGSIAGFFDAELGEFDVHDDADEYMPSFKFAWDICVKELVVEISS